jgi:2'-hydroxyisoflavone reductase
MKTRREFMVTAGGIAVGAAFVPSALAAVGRRREDAKLKILILGGTGFLGPSIVKRAQEAGHELTLFNRGKTGPDMFPELEHIEGDRYTDLSGLEKAVAEGRKWDAVIDTFTYVPKTVTDAMDVLLPAMGQFVVISTTSVYASSDEAGMDEGGALATVTDEVAAGIETHQQVGMHYGAMKARVEKAAEERFPGRVTVIRPGLIVGPRDTSGRYTYWPARASEGGTMIGPGTGADFVQVVDVRDLGDFTVTCIERKHLGVYNAVSPDGKFTIKDVVDSCVRVAGAGTSVEWVDAEFLAAQGVQAWQHMPAWVPNDAPGYRGFGRMSTAKSIAAGLKTRDLDETNRDTLAYYTERAKELEAERGAEFVVGWRKQIRGGLDPALEATALEAWKNRTP